MAVNGEKGKRTKNAASGEKKLRKKLCTSRRRKKGIKTRGELIDINFVC